MLRNTGLKLKTRLKAGGFKMQHNQTIALSACVGTGLKGWRRRGREIVPRWPRV